MGASGLRPSDDVRVQERGHGAAVERLSLHGGALDHFTRRPAAGLGAPAGGTASRLLGPVTLDRVYIARMLKNLFAKLGLRQRSDEEGYSAETTRRETRREEARDALSTRTPSAPDAPLDRPTGDNPSDRS